MPAHQMPLKAAADKIGLSEATLRRRIHDGTLPAELVGQRWMIAPADLDRLRKPAPAGMSSTPAADDAITQWARDVAATAPPLSEGQRTVIVTVLGGVAA